MGLRKILEEPDHAITLSDGTRLSARIWRPVDSDADPVPAILEFLPYRKRDGTVARDALTHPYFAQRGYACLRVDIRGTGDSAGILHDEYTQTELDDAVEIIDWLGRQPWCSGNVGMMGISWGGFNALQVAAMQPKALKAIITLCSTHDRYADDIHYKGGCLLNENLGWGATMWAYSSRPPDPALVGDKWRDMWLERLAAEPFLPATWLGHQTRDSYWQHGSVCENYAEIKAATLAIGGWGDGYKNAVPALVQNLDAPAKGILGPWVHKYPHFAVPGPQIGFLQEALRWWDKWLKGIDTGVENDPDLRLYQMDGLRPAAWYDHRPGRWITESKQDFAALDTKTLHFVQDGAQDGTQNGALLSDVQPHVQTIDALIASPQHTGGASGEYCAIWLGPEMPGDQRGDDAFSLCFESEPMAQDMEITGAPSVMLRLASDRPQAQIAVRLNHIHPDGAAARITYGVLNLTHRDSHADPTPLEPGRAYDVALALDHIAYRVPQGHRLRVAISTAYWPLIWPSPEAAQLVVSMGKIELPLRQGSGADEWQFEAPEASAPWKCREIRPAENSRISETDAGTGLVTLKITDDFGEYEDLDHGMICGSIAREWWAIHPDDPLSARGRTHWTETLRRGDWSVRTETHAEMWSDSQNFYLTARLEAFEGDKKIYERRVTETLGRHEK